MALRCVLFLFLLVNYSLSASAAVVVINPVVVEESVTGPLEELLTLDNQAIGERMGRKLKFKERLAISILRGKMKRAKKRAERRAAKGNAPPMGRDWTPVAALVFLILALLFFPFVLPAIIFAAIGMKRNRDIDPGRYKLAKTCFIISLVALIAIVFLLLLLVALFASWGG